MRLLLTAAAVSGMLCLTACSEKQFERMMRGATHSSARDSYDEEDDDSYEDERDYGRDPYKHRHR